MSNPIMQYFAYSHLPEKLQAVSKPIGELAELMDTMLPDGAEKSAGLRKLLEAKDCFVRAALGQELKIPDVKQRDILHVAVGDINWLPNAEDLKLIVDQFMSSGCNEVRQYVQLPSGARIDFEVLSKTDQEVVMLSNVDQQTILQIKHCGE